MKGKFSIGRRISNVREDFFVIEIEDDISGIRIIEIEVTPHDLAMALSARSGLDCEIKYLVNEKQFNDIGKIRKMKAVFIERPTVYGENKRKEYVRNVIKNNGFLVDGWEIWDDGCNRQQEQKHRVILYKYE